MENALQLKAVSRQPVATNWSIGRYALRHLCCQHVHIGCWVGEGPSCTSQVAFSSLWWSSRFAACRGGHRMWVDLHVCLGGHHGHIALRTDRLKIRFPGQGSSWKPGWVVSRQVTRESGNLGRLTAKIDPENQFFPSGSCDFQLVT